MHSALLLFTSLRNLVPAAGMGFVIKEVGAYIFVKLDRSSKASYTKPFLMYILSRRPTCCAGEADGFAWWICPDPQLMTHENSDIW